MRSSALTCVPLICRVKASKRYLVHRAIRGRLVYPGFCEGQSLSSNLTSQAQGSVPMTGVGRSLKKFSNSRLSLTRPRIRLCCYPYVKAVPYNRRGGEMILEGDECIKRKRSAMELEELDEQVSIVHLSLPWPEIEPGWSMFFSVGSLVYR